MAPGPGRLRRAGGTSARAAGCPARPAGLVARRFHQAREVFNRLAGQVPSEPDSSMKEAEDQLCDAGWLIATKEPCNGCHSARAAAIAAAQACSEVQRPCRALSRAPYVFGAAADMHETSGPTRVGPTVR